MFYTLSILAIVVVVGLFLLVLFEPGLNYNVAPPELALDSEEYLCLLGALSDAQVLRDSTIDVFADGRSFYDVQLDAIRNARRSVNLEAYIFRNDEIGRRFIEALAERARGGVKVNVVIDAIGSFATRAKAFVSLRDAGGRVCRYQPLSLSTLKRWNNRTHRNLLIVDGETGFLGGAGIGDNWLTGEKNEPPWRDTVCRVTGDLVIGLQSTFTENWLKAAEEILTGDEYFPRCVHKTESDGVAAQGEAAGFVVNSSPSAGRSSRARVLFQALLASAKKSIHVNSPYFLPDRGVRRELLKAVERGVTVKIIAPGDRADHLLTRRASRRRYGELLKGGAEVFEYQPAMNHAKILIVDDVWAVVGSTNFDHRSFGLNDEVNLVARCPPLAARLEEDFARDLAQSRPISYEEWCRRPWTERIVETLGRIIERHQ